MKCPFELPAEKYEPMKIIRDKTKAYIYGYATDEGADFILLVINSHKKMRTALKVILDHEDLRRKAGIGYDSVVDEYSKQALKTEKL